MIFVNDSAAHINKFMLLYALSVVMSDIMSVTGC